MKFKEEMTFTETEEIIRKFRSKVIAHIKNENSSEIAKECMELEKKHGFVKIYSEWENFKSYIYTKIKEKKSSKKKINKI